MQAKMYNAFRLCIVCKIMQGKKFVIKWGIPFVDEKGIQRRPKPPDPRPHLVSCHKSSGRGCALYTYKFLCFSFFLKCWNTSCIVSFKTWKILLCHWLFLNQSDDNMLLHEKWDLLYEWTKGRKCFCCILQS